MSTSSWIGKKLSDRYEIEELLGQGGMSSVFKAFDPNLRRVVAVKMIHPHLSNDPSFVARFEEEAASVAQLRNSNIIQVYDFANDGDTYYMVMEFVPGETLELHLKRLLASDRRMEIRDAIKYTIDICNSLDYAHNRGLIHRDVKPANIMLNLLGEAILMDFGIVKIVGGRQHTSTGAVVGTALYMAPEIIKGEHVDRRTDIYSLGVTLFESLTGRPPFQADSAMSVMMMQVNDPVPDLREINQDVPEALVNVVRKALAKDREDRFQTGAEFAAALENIDLSQPALKQFGATAIEPSGDSWESTMIEPQPSKPSPGRTRQEAQRPVTPQRQRPTSVEASRSVTNPDFGTAPLPAPGFPSNATVAGRRKGVSPGLWIGGGIIGVLVIFLGVFFGARALGFAGVENTPTQDVMAATTAAPNQDVEPSATTEPAVIIAPTDTPEPTLAPTQTPTATDPPGPYVRINDIRIENSYYIVDYETFGYTEVLPGVHIHFYFNNIAPEDAGAGGSGPWYLWGGPRPFNGYTVNDRPSNATQLCALQANADHTINLNTGNCFYLPNE